MTDTVSSPPANADSSDDLTESAVIRIKYFPGCRTYGDLFNLFGLQWFGYPLSSLYFSLRRLYLRPSVENPKDYVAIFLQSIVCIFIFQHFMLFSKSAIVDPNFSTKFTFSFQLLNKDPSLSQPPSSMYFIFS